MADENGVTVEGENVEASMGADTTPTPVESGEQEVEKTASESESEETGAEEVAPTEEGEAAAA